MAYSVRWYCGVIKYVVTVKIIILYIIIIIIYVGTILMYTRYYYNFYKESDEEIQ